MSDTPLGRQLRGEVAPKPDAVAAFKIARRWFLEGRRLDMGDLADELGVSRATLFRWVGNRDQLLGEIFSDLAVKTFQRARDEQTETTGAARVAAIVGGFVHYLAAAERYVELVRAEPERTLRIATTKAFGVQRLVIAEVEHLLRDELEPASGELSQHDLAFLIVRIAESVLYTDVISGEPPKPEITERAVRALLG